MDIFNTDTINLIEEIKSSNKNSVIGFTCSCFDLMHAGHCLMLEDSKRQCDILVIGLQTDPTIDRSWKNKPIQSYKEREIVIKSNKWIDYIIKYQTEQDLINILDYLKPNVRIIGSDYLGKDFTGKEMDIKIYYHKRDYPYSSTIMRRRIWEEENKNYT